MSAENIYCAFLRGINVNGRNMKMADVQEVFNEAGMMNVLSVLATGNIIFQSDNARDNLRNKLEQAMLEHYKTKVHMIVKSFQEIENIVNSTPFNSTQSCTAMY